MIPLDQRNRNDCQTACEKTLFKLFHLIEGAVGTESSSQSVRGTMSIGPLLSLSPFGQQCKGSHPTCCRTCSAASKGRQSPREKWCGVCTHEPAAKMEGATVLSVAAQAGRAGTWLALLLLPLCWAETPQKYARNDVCPVLMRKLSWQRSVLQKVYFPFFLWKTKYLHLGHQE